MEGNYSTSWDDVKTHSLTAADNLKVLRFVYDGGNGERRLPLQVHAVPSLIKDLVQADHNTAVCMGDSYILEADVDGESLGYRWQRATGAAAPSDAAVWSDVTGGSSAALRFSVGGDAWYRCLATGVCIDKTNNTKATIGGKTYLVSTAVKVSHTTKPVIDEGFNLSGNTDLLNVCEGTSFSTVFTDANKPTVQKAGDGVTPGTGSEGWMLGGVKVTAGHTITAADNGKALGYWAMNRCGESIATFNTLTLKVSGRVSILQSPAAQTVNEGGRVSLSVLTAAPAECTYQWEIYDAAGAAWSAAPAGESGNDQAVYTFTTPSGDDVPADRRGADSYTDRYRSVITSSNACGATDIQESDAARVTVTRSSTAVVISAHPSDGEVCAGEVHELQVTAKNRTALSFQWYRDGREVTAADGELVLPTGDHATGTTCVFRAKVSGTYYCLVTSVDNPTGTRTAESAVIVHAIPSVLTDIADATICKGSTTTLKYVVSGDNVTYKWSNKSNAGTTLGTGSILDVTPDATATYVVQVTAACSDQAPGLFEKEVRVTVNDKPAITGGPNDIIRLCEGTVIGNPTAVSVDFKGSAEISQGWTLSGIDIDPAVYTVSTADRGKVIAYRAKNGCGETVNYFAGKATLSIDKRPQLLQSPSDVTVEEGTQVRLSVLTGDKDVTYKWVGTSDETDVLSTASAYSYTPNELTGDELNTGNRTEQYYCIITAAAGSTCKGDNASAHPETETGLAFEKSSIATVKIQRRTTSITITKQASEVYPEACAKDAAGTIDETLFPAGIGITAAGRGSLTFTWYKNGKVVATGDGTVENSSETPLPDDGRDPLTPTVLQSSTYHPTAAGTYFCRVSSSDNASGVRSEQVVLTVHPPVTLTSADLDGGTETLCEDSNLSLTVAATGDNRSYRWEWKSADAAADTYAAIPGETDSRLRTAVDGSKTYRCVLTASCADGISPAATTKLSQTHTVNISLKPSITLTKSDAYKTASVFRLCEGAALSPTTFATVAVDNHGNTDNIDEWWTLGGQQTAVAYPVKSTDNNKTPGYYAQNGCGVTTAVLPLSLEVNELPLIVTQPQGTEVQAGSQVRLVVSASVGKGTLKYQWQKKGASDTDFADLPADNATATTPAYVFTAEEVSSVSPDNVKTTYRCHITLDGSACSYDDYTEEAIVTVTRRKSSISITEQPVCYGICSSTAASGYDRLTVAVSGTANFTYTWYKQGETGPVRTAVLKTAGTTGYDRDSYPPTVPGIYYCKVTSEDDPTGLLSQPATVTLYEEPDNITLTEASPSMCEGSVRVLGIASNGSNLTYEWHRSSDAAGSSSMETCVGGNAQTYTPHGLKNGTYYYYCKVANSNCPAKYKSKVITLTVNQSATITEQPLSKTICSGTDLELKVEASTDKANGYAWYANGTKIDGHTSATLMLDKTKVKGGVYTCEVSTEHCGSVISSPSLVTVAGIPSVQLGSATGLTACRGDLITLPSPVVEANGSIIVPDKTGWYVTNKASLVSSALVSSTVTYQYLLSYKCSDEPMSITSEVENTPEYTIAMTPQPAFGAGVLQDVTLNSGEDVTADQLVTTEIAVGAGDTYHYLLGGTPVTLPYLVSAADDGKIFECVALNACGEETKLSSTAVLKVNSLEITTQPLSLTYCEGDAGKKLIVAANTDAGVSYKWYKDDAPISPAAVGKEYVLKGIPADAGVYTCEVKLGPLTVMSTPAVVRVKRKLALVNGANETLTVCKGLPLTLQTEAAGDGLHYAWKKGTDGIGSDASSLSIAEAEGAAYTCTVSGDCPSPGTLTRSIIVTVNTPATVTKQPADQMGGCTYAALGVAAGGTSPSFLWYKDGTKLTSGTGYNTQDYTPTSDGVYYCLVSVDHCGSVMSGPAVVRKSVAVSGTPAASADRTTICKGESVTLSATGVSGDGLSYVWKSGVAEVGYGATVSVSPAATADYTCTATGTCGVATSAAVTVTVNDPVVITKQPVGGEVCDAEYQLDITASATGIGYQWYKDGVEVRGATSASYTVPKTEVGAHQYYCLVSGTCGSKTSASVRVNIVQPPTFASTKELHTQYTGFVSEPLVLPAVPVYDANGSTITGGRWVYGTDTELGSVFQQDYNKQELKYEVSYTGVCNTAGGTVLSPKQGSMRVADFMSDAVPEDIVAGKFYYMMDARDRKVYKIKKVTDGQVWMVQNLDYGTCTLPYNSENSQKSVQGIMGENGLLYGICKSSADVDGTPLDDGTTYKLYNWQGVMSDADAYYNSATSNPDWAGNWQGICPKGWHVQQAGAWKGPFVATGLYDRNFLCDETPTTLCLMRSSHLNKDGNVICYNWGAQWGRDYQSQTDAYMVVPVYNIPDSRQMTSDKGVGMPTRCVMNKMTLTASANRTTVCKGESITLSATGVSGKGFLYVWKSSGTEVGQGAMVNVSPAATADYTCTVTDAHGRTMASATVAVTVNDPVVITKQPVGGEVCNAEHQLDITASVTGIGYQWYKDGVEVSGATSASYTVPKTEVGAHQYYCLVSGTCGSKTSASVGVNIVQPPTFASTTELNTQYTGFVSDPIILPTAPAYNANGSTITGGRWVYGTGTALGSVWQQDYQKQDLKYELSYTGVCSATGATVLSVKQGSLRVADFMSDAVPDDLVVGKFYYMMDARDRKVYKTKKFSNGETWMVQNLDYGTCTLPYNYTNSGGSVQGIKDHTGSMLYGVCKSSADVSGAPLDNGTTWKYYNWQGAMNDADAYKSSGGKKTEWFSKWQGICPAGWHIANCKPRDVSIAELVGNMANAVSTAESDVSFCATISGYYNGYYGVINWRDTGHGYDTWIMIEDYTKTWDGWSIPALTLTDGYFTPGRGEFSSVGASYGGPLRCMKN